MFKNKKIRFYSSKIVNDQAIDDSYLNAVESKKKELQVELEEKIKKIQQPIQQDIQQLNEDIQQLNKRIRDYNSILKQLPTPKKNEEEKFSNPTGVEVQLEQKNTDNIAALEQTQNSQDNSSFKLQQDIKKQENQVNPLPTPSGGLGVNDELAKKVAERSALLDKQDNINTSNVRYSKELVEKQDIQERKQSVKSDNPVSSITEELARIFAERNKISERNNNSITEKDKVISFTTNVSPDEQSKLSERAAVEVQVQKNTDNIPASEQTQNSQDNFSLLQQLKASRKQLIHIETTVQEDNLPDWVKSEFIDSAAEKKLLEEKKEHDLFNFLETVCHRTDLSEEDSQEIIKFHDKVYNVKLRVGNEAEKKQFRNAVSKIVEEITRPNSICDAEYNNNLKIINEFINENNTQQQSQNSPSLQPRR